MRFFINLLLFLVLIPKIYAASLGNNSISEVVKVRGEISQLSPGSLMARRVAFGDKLTAGTSIVTGYNSFIKIKFIDNSEINIGPETKIVINQTRKDSAVVISLLKGQIRAEIKNNSNDPTLNKFLIKTRTAVIGCREAEFQTIYNPKNTVTSLLTFKGEVSMVKLNEKIYQNTEIATEQKIVREDLLNAPKIQNVYRENDDIFQVLNLILKNKATVIVYSGQSSFSIENFKKATLPVSISELQLEAIYKNKDFIEKDTNHLNLQSAIDTLESTRTNRTLFVTKQTAPVEGYFNEATDEFAPKSLGFIDSKTALYIAPIYDVNNMGSIDADTGQYVVPKGFILDSSNGFVLVDDGDKNTQKDQAFLILKKNLNKNIARGSVLVATSVEAELVFKIDDKFISDRISVSFFNLNQNVIANETSTADPYLKLASSNAFRLAIEWSMASNGRFSPLLGLEYAVVNYSDKESKGVGLDSRNLLGLTYGFQFALSKIFNVYSKLGFIQDHYLDQLQVVTNNTYHLQKIIITRLTIGASAEFWQKNKFSLDVNVNTFYTFHKRMNNIVVNHGNGYQIEILPKFLLTEKRWIGLGMRKESQGQKTSGRVGANEIKRDSSGLELKYLSDF